MTKLIDSTVYNLKCKKIKLICIDFDNTLISIHTYGKWNDNPNTAGTALSSLVVDGVTFNQTGRSGRTESVLTVSHGTDYPITINPGTGYGGNEVQGTQIGFFDLDGQDYNAQLTITIRIRIVLDISQNLHMI